MNVYQKWVKTRLKVDPEIKELKGKMRRISIAGHGGGNERSLAYKMLSESPKQWDVVFINNPTEAPPHWLPELAKSYCHLQFDDINTEFKTLRTPKIEDVQKALQWAKEGKEDVLVSCHAGVSRSAAIAYVLAASEYLPEDAIGVLNPERHQPNRLIVEIGSKLLEDKKVWTEFVQWQDRIDPDAQSILERTRY